MIIEVTYSEQLDIRHRVRWVALDGSLTNHSDLAADFEDIAAAGRHLAVVQEICEAADLVIEAVSIRPTLLSHPRPAAST